MICKRESLCSSYLRWWIPRECEFTCDYRPSTTGGKAFPLSRTDFFYVVLNNNYNGNNDNTNNNIDDIKK